MKQLTEGEESVNWLPSIYQTREENIFKPVLMWWVVNMSTPPPAVFLFFDRSYRCKLVAIQIIRDARFSLKIPTTTGIEPASHSIERVQSNMS